MRKSLLIFSAIMIFSTIIASADEDSSSTTEKIKAFFKKKIKKANNKIERFNPIVSCAKKEYKECLEPTLSVNTEFQQICVDIHTPTFGVFLASCIGFGLFINNPSLKLAFFAALLVPYATEVCTKTTAQSIVKTNNHDSSYMISDIIAQNALIATHGD